MDRPGIRVVLCWHMHQPQYRDLVSGEYFLPWTYLHAIKDYVDMAAVIEACPAARAVVNFSPVLLEQIQDYAGNLREHLTSGIRLRDPLLAALASLDRPFSPERKLELVRQCLQAHPIHMIQRFPAYATLADMARHLLAHPETEPYLSDQFVTDILVWFHLAWLGETVRLGDARVQALLEKACGFTPAHCRDLLCVISELLSSLPERYRHLALSGQIELSLSPGSHPILPLLIDWHSALETMPDAPLPQVGAYPQGLERARWHLQYGREIFEAVFGFPSLGCWPSEGAVSTATLKLLADSGFHWVASGQAVLHNSLSASGEREHDCIHHAYRLPGADITCFFRDDQLSDLIGFSYAHWQPEDAVANLIHHLLNIADACKAAPGGVVPIIMDGENAWEHYPHNAHAFLTRLYAALSTHPQIQLITFKAYLAGELASIPLPQLVAGSWVNGTLATWIGSEHKNRGWALLCRAKEHFDRQVALGSLQGERLRQAQLQLAVCEGSDWFWWLGDYNPADTVQTFEQLFRQQLTVLYQILGERVPDELREPISLGGGEMAVGGVMRRADDSVDTP